MESKPKDYSIIIKEVRKQLGISQEDLAREIGVSFATVNRWENRHSKPSPLALREIQRLCKGIK